MRVNLVSGISVVNDGVTVGERMLGGRRARVVLAALALSRYPLTGEQLAAIVWADDLPATWPAALRGIVRALRTACAPPAVGASTSSSRRRSGYRLADGVEVDVERRCQPAAQDGLACSPRAGIRR